MTVKEEQNETPTYSCDHRSGDEWDRHSMCPRNELQHLSGWLPFRLDGWGSRGWRPRHVSDFLQSGGTRFCRELQYFRLRQCLSLWQGDPPRCPRTWGG